MALARVKTWAAEVLTYSDLNAEFNNILNNPTSLISDVCAVATQAQLETATSIVTFTSPGRQQYHPSAVKAWCRWNAGTTIDASYNITSITDTGTGDWTVNIATDFSGANYHAVYSALDIGTAGGAWLGSAAAGTQRCVLRDAAGALTDGGSVNWYLACGDQ